MPTIEVGARAILPKTTLRQKFDRILKEAEKEIEGPVKEEVKAIFGEIVSNWKVKPSFAAMKIVQPNQLGIKVYAKGAGKQRFDWLWMGVKPHRIPVSGETLMTFRHGSGWSPKTRPGNPPTYGHAGSNSGPWVSKHVILKHPGIEARRFDLLVREKYQPKFRNRMHNALRRGIRGVGG